MIRPVLIASILLSVALQAQAPTPPSRLASLAREGRIRLSLDDAIGLALEEHLDVQLQRLGPALAEAEARRTLSGAPARPIPLSVREGPKSASSTAAEAIASVLGAGPETNLSIGNPTVAGPAVPALDPALTGRVSRSHTTAPQVNSFQTGATTLTGAASAWSLGWQQGFLTGGVLSFALENSRQSLNHPRYDLNPFFVTSLGVTFTQPLLRGFGPALNSRFIRVARNSRGQADLVFEQQLVSTTSAVIRLYWDLARLSEEVGVRRQALERARRLLDDTQVHVEVGTRAPIELVRARAEVARAERDLIVAEGQRRQQETILKDYLSPGTVGDPALAGVTIETADRLPADPREPVPAAADLAARALAERPDIRQARLQIESHRVALAGSRNARLPALDLTASARSNGLAGAVNPLGLPGAAPHTPEPSLIGSYGTALGQLTRRDFPDYSLALQLSLPLLNRAAEADYARDAVALQQQELRLRQLEKQVYVEIENARLAVEQAGASLAVAEREREFQEQALAAEEEKLGIGASTTYLVIQYQRDLAQARAAGVAARSEYLKARAALQRAAGMLLDAHGITVAGTDIHHR
jgi:outer membrane protein TolC